MKRAKAAAEFTTARATNTANTQKADQASADLKQAREESQAHSRQVKDHLRSPK